MADRTPGVDVTFRLTGIGKRGRIHLKVKDSPEEWITLSPNPAHALYGGHAYERLLELLLARRG